MEFVDLKRTHDAGEDHNMWLINAVLEPDEPGIHMVGTSIEWLMEYWDHLDPNAPRQTLKVPAPGDRLQSPYEDKVLVLELGNEHIEIASGPVPLQGYVSSGEYGQGDEPAVKLDQAYIFAGFMKEGPVVFIENHVMLYEERYAPGNWDYQYRFIRRDEWNTDSGELIKREEISQY